MSLLVHELVIGTGGAGSGSSSLHASPTKPPTVAQNNSALSSVTHNGGALAVVTHNSNQLHFPQLQQNRVVTIASGSHSRLPLSTSESGSKLAEALAGNVTFAYTTPLHVSTSHTLSKTSSTPIQQVQCHQTPKPTRQTYNLPFVLQDHNYGAPPPVTPPHSPPQTVLLSPLQNSFKIQPGNNNSGGKVSHVSANKSPDVGCPQKVISEHSTPLNSSRSSASSCSDSPVKSLVTNKLPCEAPQFLASMPLHRQQFMPQPRLAGFHSHVLHGSKDDLSTAPNASVTNGIDTDDESRLSERSSSVGPSGEETETAPEGDGEEHVQADDSITRCVCDFTHDDGYMIQCDRCLVWQHVDCMEIDRNNIPDEYLCEACSPRPIDKFKARSLQVKRRQEIRLHLARLSSSDSDDNISHPSIKNRTVGSKSLERKVLKKKKPRVTKEHKSRKHGQANKKTSLVSPTSSVSSKVNPVNEEKDKKPLLKSRRRQSSTSTIEPSEENNGAFTLEQLKTWLEDYEVAVTNHYSPELRARVHSARLLNGISSEFRDSTQGAMLGLRCKVAPNYNSKAESFETKVLVATTTLTAGTAIIEFQGKYTLQSQWNATQVPLGLPYLPFVLQYIMSKEGLGVCVDARTYGNDARFCRRSSEYNAEIRHVIERGSVHLYIVASKNIEPEDEIFLSLDTAICSPTTITKQPGSQKLVHNPEPYAPAPTDLLISVDDDTSQIIEESPIRKNGAFQAKKATKKQHVSPVTPSPSPTRSSRRTTSVESTTEDLLIINPITSPVKQRRASGCSTKSAKSPVKSPMKSPLKTLSEDGSKSDHSLIGSPQHDGSGTTDKDMHKMTREERKIAAYMKAFEMMEKASQRKKEMAKRKGVDKDKNIDHDDGDASKTDHEEEEPKQKRRRKTTGNTDSPRKTTEDLNVSAIIDDYSHSENEKNKSPDGSGSQSAPPGIQSGFRFPKTKKALMNEWLNETVDHVLPSALSNSSETTTGIPTCYMRSPTTPSRRGSGANMQRNGGIHLTEMAGRSAKKRWLRQAIIDETEPQNNHFAFCSSPNSRPDSPNAAGDYTTPLKKRRLARESMSSEQSNTPPTTPVHSSLEEDKLSVESETDLTLNVDVVEDEKPLNISSIQTEFIKKEIKEESFDSKDDIEDRITVNILELSKVCDNKIKMEVEQLPELENKVKVEDSDEILEKPLDVYVKNESKSPAKRKKLNRTSNLKLEIKNFKTLRKSKKSPIIRNNSELPLLRTRSSKNKLDSSLKNIGPNKNKNFKTKKCGKVKIKEQETNQAALDEENKESPIVKESYNPVSLKELCKFSIENECSKSPKRPFIASGKGPQTPECTPEKAEAQEIFSFSNIGPKTPDGTPPETPSKNQGENVFPDAVCGKDAAAAFCLSPVIDNTLSDKRDEDHNTVEDNEASQYNKSHKFEEISYKPPPVKKKLSILEYRKRKSVGLEHDAREDLKTLPTPISETMPGSLLLMEKHSNIATLEKDQALPGMPKEFPLPPYPAELLQPAPPPLPSPPSPPPPPPPFEDDDDLSGSPPSPPSPSFALKNYLESDGLNNISTANAHSNIKWSSKPTLVEQQRENLTARLRREFGLCVVDEENRREALEKRTLGNRLHVSMPNPPPPGRLDGELISKFPPVSPLFKDDRPSLSQHPKLDDKTFKNVPFLPSQARLTKSDMTSSFAIADSSNIEKEVTRSPHHPMGFL